MKRTRIVILLCLLLTGCTVPERFDNASVDTDGSLYVKCEPAKIAAAWNEYCNNFLAAASSVPGPNGTETVKDLLFIKLLFRYTGINEITALKMSSTAAENGLYSNKIAVKIAENVSGGTSFFGNNKTVLKELGHLPEDCSDIIAFSVDFTKLQKMLENSKLELKPLITTHSKIFFGTTPDKAAARHSGVWILSMRQPRRETLISLSIPDAEKNLYNHWKKLFAQKQDILKIKITQNQEYFVTHRNGRTEMYPSKNELDIYCAKGKTLAGNPEFKNSFADKFNDFVFLTWSNAGDAHSKTFGCAKTEGEKLLYPEFFVIRRTPYGFYGCGTDKNDLSVNLFRDHLLTLFEYTPLQKLFSSKDNTPVQKRQEKHSDKGEKVCFENLQKISKCLSRYAKKNGNTLPDGLHTDGLNKLSADTSFDASCLCCPGSGSEPAQKGDLLYAENTGYVYFGNWKADSSDKLPLLMDIPENHGNFFHVLLHDGSVRKISFKQQMSVKRMASFLHTIYKYNEEEFSELIRRANELDKILDRESK